MKSVQLNLVTPNGEDIRSIVLTDLPEWAKFLTIDSKGWVEVYSDKPVFEPFEGEDSGEYFVSVYTLDQDEALIQLPGTFYTHRCVELIEPLTVVDCFG